MSRCLRQFAAAACMTAGLLVIQPSSVASAQVHDHVTPPAKVTPEPLFDNLGTYHRAIRTSSPQAQRFFDQGLRLLFAFNLEEAQRSFERATELDPQCAICFWGVGMSLGPHVNYPARPERTVAANKAAQQALTMAVGARAPEKALIEALAKRYADPAPTDPAAQHTLDQGYSDAMRAAAKAFPDDLDIQALTAEGLMNLHPWDYWGAAGDAKEGTAEILHLLETVLKRNPNHPGANHYYIHAVEASNDPARGLPSADRIARLMPGQGHMVHMPSHLYARVGRYAEAAEANRKAIAADDKYVGAAGPQGIYAMYYAHNHQFLWWTALMEGRSAEALTEARAVSGMVPVEMLHQMPGFDGVLAYPSWTLLRVGRFDEVLKEPAPPAGFPYLEAVTHAARGIALVRLGRAAEARVEADAVTALGKQIPADAPEGLNTASGLWSIAGDVLQGELARAAGNGAEAERLLRAAVATEAGLRYDEPPDWFYPASSHLGDFLLASGRAADAQAAFEAELERYPNNGWALAGLTASLRAQKKIAETRAAETRLAKAWSRADIPRPLAGMLKN
ncbi:MAG: hypothetical protein ABI609_02095 [Acidobacteriota bacterium]